MNFVFCFLSPECEYPDGIDLLIYDKTALDNDEEADYDKFIETFPNQSDLLFEACEFCYTFNEGVTKEQVRKQLTGLGMVEMPELESRIDDLPI